MQEPSPPKPLARPERITYAQHNLDKGRLDDLALMPKIKWYADMAAFWDVSENGAQKRLNDFLEDGLKGYKEKRNRPDMDHVSRLSPYLHHGQISPRQVWYMAQDYAASNKVPEADNSTSSGCAAITRILLIINLVS